MRCTARTLAYNGALYNYLELKQDLCVRGHTFTTESDTEVLLRMIVQHGWEGLDQCEGMWAFALYDDQSGTLILSRDRFGEKPLHVYRESGGLYFGSQVQFINALRGRGVEVNYEHLYRYLVNGYKSLHKVQETFFVGVEELSPSTVLTVDASGGERQRRYWRPSFAQDESMTYANAVEGVRSAVIDPVRLRLRADVPLAFCMSGGVDSNGLIAIAKRHCDFDVHGFTITTDDERYDEREEVGHAVSALGIRHTSVPVTTRDFCDNLRALIRRHDAPVYTVSYYVQWLLMAAVARQGYRVCISGTAADELLTGYYDHHNLWLYEIGSRRDLPKRCLRGESTWPHGCGTLF